MSKYHNEKVIILIDEYDVPLENAFFEGFYNEMISFIRSLFESALKTNPSLEFSVITGCLPFLKGSSLSRAEEPLNCHYTLCVHTHPLVHHPRIHCQIFQSVLHPSSRRVKVCARTINVLFVVLHSAGVSPISD